MESDTAALTADAIATAGELSSRDQAIREHVAALGDLFTERQRLRVELEDVGALIDYRIARLREVES